MVNEQEQNSGRRRANQGVRDVIPEPNKINASTLYDFNGRNLTPYGGLLPVITMLEKRLLDRIRSGGRLADGCRNGVSRVDSKVLDRQRVHQNPPMAGL